MQEPEAKYILFGLDVLENEEKSRIPHKDFLRLKEKLHDKAEDINEFLDALSDVFFDRKLSPTIARCFPKLVLQLISLMPHKPTDSIQGLRKHLNNCIILGKLVSLHPDVLQFSLQYLDDKPSPLNYFNKLQKVPQSQKVSSSNIANIQLVEVLDCCCNFLKMAPDIFAHKWDWLPFVELFTSTKNSQVNRLACQYISIILGMSEKQSCELEEAVLSSVDGISELINQSQKHSFSSLCEKFPRQSSKLMPTFSDNVVNVSGVLLPIYNNKCNGQGDLVSVKSNQENLRSLALAVASGKATCLSGPVGCGKTALVEHLAALTGRTQETFKKIQLGDQTDSRTLLGTYRCTDIPGDFIWQPGVLTQCVQQGYWLLLEDIDCAAIDVASVLSSLLERNVLSVPGYKDALPVAPGFQLFVTQRTVNTVTGYQKPSSNACVLLQKHWAQINVEPLSRSELITIVESLFPKLKTIASRMVDVFLLFSVGGHHSSLHNMQTEECAPLVKTLSEDTSDMLSLKSGRLTSTRDLIKWCTRAQIEFDISSTDSALKVLQDALDIFVCSVPDQESRVPLAIGIGAYLGIVETKAKYFCDAYKPNVSLQPDALQIGRVVIPRKPKPVTAVNLNEKKVTFSFTRRSTCLLERIACCVNSKEPVLLVGETGTGKTSSIQYLAKETGHKLIVINMNQQSDSADLLGGYKPVDFKYIMSPMRDEFEELFRSYFDPVQNARYLGFVSLVFNNEKWDMLTDMMHNSQEAAIKRLTATNVETIIRTGKKESTDPGTEHEKSVMLDKWRRFGDKVARLRKQVNTRSSLAFSFIEGSLVRALKDGHWVLLDEINLASAETLECLSGLLEGSKSSICLLERGDNTPIERHPDFTLFACMNPATDVGKRDLPIGLRNRFTEFYVEELTDRNDLLLLVGDYLKDLTVPQSILESIYKFYINIRKEAKLSLTDGTGQSPHYSLRTLCRALSAAIGAQCGTVTRSLYETTCLSFLTQLDSSSHPRVQDMIASAVLGKKNLKSVLKQPIPEPSSASGQKFVPFEGYWVPQGKVPPVIPDDYVLTASVRNNLRDLVRIISLGKLPILLQGDTSVGKTSLITYIAKVSGNHCVRINNHQHTDLQEYVGSYATDASGKLIFKEGVLVEAMRKGHWIILDELNLAPSDVLEALNRVLDDNRELFIPETQQVVKADPNFMLFATQNPPGVYGGRKLLSRAFRNRFVELHFDEIPKTELETILHQRCHMPPSYCKKVISVMSELQARRKGSAAVQGKEGFITLRDLFRWGLRYREASNKNEAGKYYDWDQHIADEGYLVLAGRVRQPEERTIIQEVIKKHIKRTVEPDHLFTLSDKTSTVTRDVLKLVLENTVEDFEHVVWTYNMRKLAVLAAKSFAFNEPVLLVGETGCGKTTICQVFASIFKKKLFSVNCHMHSEGSDFLGGLRPVRVYNHDGKLFEWVDGPLVDALKTGQLFLADEISLADDSVLERMNSLLEPERQLLIAERSLDVLEGGDGAYIVTAQDGFHFIGTMNPGGDYGKKELSPALRNRFTEIWCDHVSSREDLLAVLEKSVDPTVTLGLSKDGTSGVGDHILDFMEWFKSTPIGQQYPCSIRDLLSWVNFINTTKMQNRLDVSEAYVHGASLIFLDCFGSGYSGGESEESLKKMKSDAFLFLINQIEQLGSSRLEKIKKVFLTTNLQLKTETLGVHFGIDPFYIPCGKPCDLATADGSEDFKFHAPTTGLNTLRLLRGLQLHKAILLEGSPGVGKTSLVTALAKASGHRVLRINLSDQTDVSDLFGAELPSDAGRFTWQDGAFLTALKNGNWILLDELNLAPQTVLEGLNACLDHRGEVFIPELNKTFKIMEGTRIFACQNPLRQGGSRRGLPKSFLNRFTQVYVDTLSNDDLLFITQSLYPEIPAKILQNMIQMNAQILDETTRLLWGYKGSPWELNLRDIQRWCDGVMQESQLSNINDFAITYEPSHMAQLLYIDRMRTVVDKKKVYNIYSKIFEENPLSLQNPQFYITCDQVHFGDTTIQRSRKEGARALVAPDKDVLILRSQLPTLKSLAQCVNMNWLAILVGPTASGKSSSVQALAQLTGRELKILPVTSAMDTTDILGGFEQADHNREMEEFIAQVDDVLKLVLRDLLIQSKFKKAMSILRYWEDLKILKNDDDVKIYNKKKKRDILRIVDEERDPDLNHQERLQHFLSCLRNYVGSEEMLDIVDNLESKRETLSESGVTCYEGKFVWVDSLLTKCLLDGSWLLIDNVNLCSSAVLDRLNGLLEPNGVLSIPERGGTMEEIKPHPDFRMFFTMDPKSGEISRAMRNRGVEIYMIGPEEHEEGNLISSLPSLDITALLSFTGLPEKYCKLFLSVHDTLCSFIQSYEKPSLCNLLQAASLTSQQILRGDNVFDAVVHSFSDVYIKSRSASDFLGTNKKISEHKNEMLKALESAVDKFSENKHDTLLCGVLSPHTFSCNDLQRKSSVVLMKQQAYFLDVAIAACNQTECIDDLTKTCYLLLNLYLLSTSEDCSLRRQYVDLQVEKMQAVTENSKKNKQSLKNLNELLHKYVQGATRHLEDRKMYPWDANTLLGIKCIQDSFDKDLVNSLTCYLYHLTAFCITNIHNNDSTTNLSVLSYSNSVLTGAIYNFTSTALLINCSSLLISLDEAIYSLFNNKSVEVGDEEACQLLLLLNWRNRFHNACSTTYLKAASSDPKEKSTIRDDVITHIEIHYKWLSKYLIKNLFALGKGIVSFADLKKVLTVVEPSLTNQNSPLRPISKHLRKYLGQPAAFPDEATFHLCSKRDVLLDKATVINNDQKTTKATVLNNILGNYQMYRKMFANINDVFDIPNETFSLNHIEFMSDVEEMEEESDRKKEISNVKKMEELCFKVQLWPVKEYLLLKAIHAYCIRLLEIFLKNFKFVHTKYETKESSYEEYTNCNVVNKLLKHLVKTVDLVPTIPIKLLAVFKTLALKNNQLDEDDIACLIENCAELLDVLTSHFDISTTTNVQYWLGFKMSNIVSKGQEALELQETKYESFSLDFPHLTYSIVNLILQHEVSHNDEKSSLVSASLIGWREQAKQLATLHHLLWKNSILANSSLFKQSVLDAKNLILSFERMALGLKCSVSRNQDIKDYQYDDNIINLVEDCVKHIEKDYNNKGTVFKNVDYKNQLNYCLRTAAILVDELRQKLGCDKSHGFTNSGTVMSEKDYIQLDVVIGRAWSLFSFCNVILFSEIGSMDPITKQRLKLAYVRDDEQVLDSLLDVRLLHNVVQGSINVSKSESDAILRWNHNSDGIVIKQVVISDGEENDVFDKQRVYSKLCEMHPHNALLMEAKGKISDDITKLSKGHSYRPLEPSFSSLSKEFSYFMKSLAPPNIVMKHYKNLFEISQTLQTILYCDHSEALPLVSVVEKANDAVRECNIWQYSVKSFYTKILKSFTPTFPDVTKPFLSSISQLTYGFNLLKNCVKKMITKLKYLNKDADFTQNLDTVMEDLVRFPIISKNCENSSRVIDILTSKSLADFLERFYLLHKSDERFDAFNKVECYRLLKTSLQELRLACITRGNVDDVSWGTLSCILNEVVATWQKQQEVIEKKKLDEDLLYVTKTKCDDLTEDEQIEEDLLVMFPSFTDTDFLDFKDPILEQKKPVKSKERPAGSASSNKDTFITFKDITQISTIHSELMNTYTCAEWLSPPKDVRLSCDYVTPLMERYSTFSGLLNNVSQGLHVTLDAKLAPSLLILISHARNSFEDSSDDVSKGGKPNFYHSCWVSESQRCLPVIDVVTKATEKLLKQWPDFPTLKDIMVVAQRILEFPLTSPVARFLTGLELLRDKIEEWNKNAHKGNNLMDAALTVAQLVVSWRRLELSCWKDSLNTAFDKLQSEAHKWWFHLYTLIDCFINEKPMKNESESPDGTTQPAQVMTAQQFIIAMQNFIEKSSLAEFSKRLDMLFTFHCHTVHLEPSPRRDGVMCILWNLHKYYSQFKTQIVQVIKDKRTPIEKKLKDFVKICTWERDLSYWAVKDLVDKAHRTLHKHIKEFEGVLQSKAYGFMVLDKSGEQVEEFVGLWDRPKRAAVLKVPLHQYTVDPQNYLTPSKISKKFLSEPNDENAVANAEDWKKRSLVSRMPTLFIKAKKLCKDTVLNSTYPGLVQSLDGFVTEIITSAKYLRELQVSEDLPKAKQKSQAKGFLQQKKKGLSDLFRSLTKMGVSYRTGLVEYSAKNGDIISFVLPPLDLQAAFQYLNSRRGDNILLSVWDGCEMYYQKCIARIGALNNNTVAPAQDLGPQNVERCRGYAAHMMLLIQDQKVKIAKYSRYLCLLRRQVAQITEICESDSPLPSQETMKYQLYKLNNILDTTVTTMDQFELMLKACPEQMMPDSNEMETQIAFDTALTDCAVVHCYKDDTTWREISGKVKQILNNAHKQKNTLKALANVLPSVYNYKNTNSVENWNVFSAHHYEVLTRAILEVQEIKNQIVNLMSSFDLQIEGIYSDECVNPMSNCLVSLLEYLEREQQLLLNDAAMDGEESEVAELQDDVNTQAESIINCILVTIQEIYKKGIEDTIPEIKDINFDEEIVENEPESNEGNKEDDVDQLICENHLKKQLLESIKEDILKLNMPKLMKMLDAILSHLKESRNLKVKEEVMRCIPLLEQITLLAEFFLTQQVAAHRVSCKMLSVLLNIFTELLTKGFCSPLEAGEESGEGESQGTLAGGMGLADGQGEKDVSERIENQDQLDDAKKPGEEKDKEDKRDCKEEDNGVEMTDDFESHLQDLEEKEGSEQDSDDEDDADKQMGDTEAGADKLDEQIWGSDEEDDDAEENQKQEKEEKGSGKPLGDKQVGAKEDDSEQEEEPTGDDNEKKKDKNKKDINEMEEPEYDDDQVDPYHGKQKPLPEPEPMDLPDDMNLDDQDGKEEQEGQDDTNPFEIDVMKDKKQPEEEREEKGDDDDKSKDKKAEESKEMDVDGDEGTDNEDENQTDKPDETDLQNKDDDEKSDEEGDAQQNEDNPEVEEIENEKEEVSKPPQVPGEENKEENDGNAPDEEEKDAANEEARPSNDKASAEDQVESSAMEKGSKDMVQTNPQIEKEKESAPYEQSQEQEGEEEKGVGQSELSENQKGHKGDRKDKPQSSARDKSRKEEQDRKDKRNKPGETDQDRALGEIKEPVQKKMKTMNIQDKDKEDENAEDEGAEQNQDQEKEADLYQHIKQAKQSDTQVIDAATKEQAEVQPVPNNPEDENVDDLNPDDDIEMDLSEDIPIDDDPVEKLDSEKMDKTNNKEKDKKLDKGDGKGEQDPTGEMGVEIEGEDVKTMTVERGVDSTIHTKLDMAKIQFGTMESSSVTGASIRQALANRGPHFGGSEESAAWHSLWGRTASQARLLTERLRLVLEPTGLSRLAGDYRTGRRINMRRVIPYIASHFRKDRIWLRRTRPAKREYHIAVAIDDSSSMCDNESKELAFESLALVSQALNLLEAGELSVLSFGQDTQILHSFSDQFTESSGSKLLQNLTFKQTKTRIAQLLDFASAMFEEQCSTSNTPNAKLLLIVSDGRGIFSEGKERVVQAVRRARQQGVFMVYLIVDNPASKVSILDIQMPTFTETGQLESIKPYLDTFPFPFYLILRDIVALPSVLSDALRQWFELAANMDK